MSSAVNEAVRSCLISGYVVEIASALDQSFWACLLDVDEPELLAAVEFVGPELFALQRYLRCRPYMSQEHH